LTVSSLPLSSFSSSFVDTIQHRSMGITNLLPQLKSITQSVHISDYSGMTAGVDGMVSIEKHQGLACVLTRAQDAALKAWSSSSISSLTRQLRPPHPHTLSLQGWLHRAIHSINSNEIVTLAIQQHNPNSTKAGKKKTAGKSKHPSWINHVINRCNLLSKHNVTPVLVIDGKLISLSSIYISRAQTFEQSQLSYS
jgi:hypothetical protein